MSNPPKVGELCKVFLPGESPWAECVSVYPDGTWEGRIDNKLIGSGSEADRQRVSDEFFGAGHGPLPAKHDFKFNDVVRFKRDTEYPIWIPAEAKGGNA